MSGHEIKRGHLAAEGFHRLAVEILREAGAQDTATAVAIRVGEPLRNYSAAVNGKRPVTVDRVALWLQRWVAVEGLPAMRIVLTADGVVVERLPG